MSFVCGGKYIPIKHTRWHAKTWKTSNIPDGTHLLDTQGLSVKLTGGRKDECNELKHIKDIYRLIY